MEFKLSDIHMGYVVVLRNRELGIVTMDINLDYRVVFDGNFIELNSFDKDLCNEYFDEKCGDNDIVKVYGLANPLNDAIAIKNRPLLWERVQRVTLDDLEALYGCKVEFIKNKEEK